MITFKRLKESRAARNAAASYFSFFSIAGCAFLSIPIAVAHLEREEIGLWSVVNQIVQYLLWMDLGVGSATGRKMVDAIARKDQLEINRWWTATRFVLFMMGLLVVVIGLLLMPYALDLFKVPPHLRNQARILLTGSVMLIGVSFPLKGVPGLLNAQERAHWNPICQGIAPWISLVVFSTMLAHGYGVISYLWGMGLASLATWTAFSLLVRTSPQVPRWDSKGLTKERFRSLFGFSLNLSGISLINAVMNSLPAMLISRAGAIGGIGMIPIYNFTARGPVMIHNLVQRMGFAFYPALQRLYVEGKREQFAKKFKQVGMLSVSLSLVAAGGVLIGTRLLVEILAGPDFFGGSAMTLWLAVGVICIPLATLFQNLRQIAGNMGKTLLVSILKVGIAITAAIPCYQHFGLAGLAAVFMLVPLVDAAYGYFRGATGCGFTPSELSKPISLAALGAICVAMMAGSLIVYHPSLGIALSLRGKTIHLPGWSEWIAGGSTAIIGLIAAFLQLMRLKQEQFPKPDNN